MKKRLLLAGVLFSFLCPAIGAHAGQLKEDLKEPRKLLTNCKSDIYYRKKYDGKWEELERIEKMLRQAAEKNGTDEKNPDIARLLKQLETTREKLKKELAKQGKVPGPIKDNPMGIKPNKPAPGPVKDNPMGIKPSKPVPETTRPESPSNSFGRKPRAGSRNSFGGSKSDGNPEGAKIFDQNKDELKAANELLKKMVNTKDLKEFFGVAESARSLFARTRQVLKTMDGIPDRKNLERSHKPAKEFKFNSVYSWTETYLKKAEKRLNVEIQGLYNVLEREAATLRQEWSPRTAAMSMEELKNTLKLLEKLETDKKKLADARTKYMAEAEKNYKRVLTKLDKATMPKDTYSGSEGAALRKKMAELYAARYPEDKVLRVVVVGEDWVERVRAKVNNDGKIEAGVYRYCHAQIAVSKKGGCTVYPVCFRKTWTGKGSTFGPAEFYSVGMSYPILEKNVKK